MIDFNKEDNRKKIGLNSDIRELTRKETGPIMPNIEANPEEAKNIIEEEKSFSPRGVLSVRDLILSGQFKIRS